jgi:hypothetical protein
MLGGAEQREQSAPRPTLAHSGLRGGVNREAGEEEGGERGRGGRQGGFQKEGAEAPTAKSGW